MIQWNKASTPWYFLSTVLAVVGFVATYLCELFTQCDVRLSALPRKAGVAYIVVTVVLFVMALTVDRWESKH